MPIVNLLRLFKKHPSYVDVTKKKQQLNPRQVIEGTEKIKELEASYFKDPKTGLTDVSLGRTQYSVGNNSLLEKDPLKNGWLHLHTHPNLDAVPSLNDVRSMLRSFVVNPKNRSSVISVIDKNGKEAGRVHIRMTDESIRQIKHLMIDFIRRFKYDKFFITPENISAKGFVFKIPSEKIGFFELFLSHFFLFSIKPKLSDATEDWSRANKHSQMSEYAYCVELYKNYLKLMIRFIPNKGYHYNQNTGHFEKI